MSSRKLKLVVIVGPTASGKSELAVTLAKKFNGEIISADSRQVYRGLDVGTVKVTGKWQTGQRNIFVYKSAPHYCIDFVSPRKTYTVAEFKKCAMKAIKDITGRGKLPILVGGTGFWVDAVVYDMELPEVPPNPGLRKQLEKKSSSELFSILKKLDPLRAETIEPDNPRRLIRAIEIAKSLGNVPQLKKRRPFDALYIGLNPPERILQRRIAKRANAQVKRGLLTETKGLLQKGVSKKRLRELGFWYRAALDCIEGKLSNDKLIERLISENIRYAKRQMRWFKRNKDICWIQKPLEAVTLAGMRLPNSTILPAPRSIRTARRAT